LQRIPFDFAIASVLVLCANFLVCDATAPGLNSHVRIQSLNLEVVKIKSSSGEPFDLVMFGDSRARQLDVDVLCKGLYGAEGRCLNASTTGGDWVTAYRIYREGADHLFAESDILVFPSDFWVEGNERTLLRNTVEYAALGQYGNFFSSVFPLSRARGPWMRRTHHFFERTGGALLAGFAPAPARPTPDEIRDREMPEASTWHHASIDRWYTPTDDDQRELLRTSGRRMLSRLVDDGHRVSMVDLPYPEIREQYVDRFFPGRRQKAISALQSLSEETGVPLIDMRASFRHPMLFKDFNHLNMKGLGAATKRLIPLVKDAQRGQQQTRS